MLINLKACFMGKIHNNTLKKINFSNFQLYLQVIHKTAPKFSKELFQIKEKIYISYYAFYLPF